MRNKKGIVSRFVVMLIMLVFLAGSLSSCMTNHHTIGKGSQTGVVKKSRQWYALWGLAKIGDKDTKNMVEPDQADYEIKTYYGVGDWFINFFLGWLTIQSRSVKVCE